MQPMHHSFQGSSLEKKLWVHLPQCLHQGHPFLDVVLVFRIPYTSLVFSSGIKDPEQRIQSNPLSLLQLITEINLVDMELRQQGAPAAVLKLGQSNPQP